jgi:N-acetylglucosaminyl-diphospho-decaprenol L-rhamnosyltransferase
MICVSIVSHQHGQMVADLVKKLLFFKCVDRIILTFNVQEVLNLPESDRLIIIENSEKKGFGENHNCAFLLCQSDYFCVMNPDILIYSNPFPALLKTFKQKQVDLLAPLILNKNHEYDDNVRKFPSIFSVFFRLFRTPKNKLNLNKNINFIYSDWVAGMFMIFKCESYSALGGFDSKYYLYYEDVDICFRFWKYGYKVGANTSVKVIHDARRANRSDLSHMSWYLISCIRFLCKFPFGIKKLRAING